MSDKGFTGKWLGQYTYGDGYAERLKGKSSGFILLMEVAGNGRVTGRCFDDGASAQNEAVIEGTIMKGNIEFIKKYRHYWNTDGDGNIMENKVRESHEVIYTGKFQNQVFSGEWKIFTSFIRTDGSIRERVIGGYWIMHREV
jgi:hypothetical protein